ncbi:hypothetical protein [Pseudomonas lini]|uniref:Uncharacterized protein n=1 Tax=Pseudomonas lini TaxID=163011 RepID=A0A7V7TMU0_9PSED|nr:hypothetical protein [Pseudomonas lini]KAB0507001.1 hypothetical protein F7R14_03775 [Pseudomonas lini]KMM88400.1 hypothetical protein TU81_27600 [Pseudomonas lini]KNH43094.1 hypothetical protein ACS73_27695 [Pseudomonas lini]NSX07496.1 hypothetical protein [Pseudomonas lini]
MATPANVTTSTVGTFKVSAIGFGSIEQGNISFEDDGEGFKVRVFKTEIGVTQSFELVFSRKQPSEQYDVKDLTALYHKESAGEYFDYGPVSGTVKVWYTDSPRKTKGEFDMEMKKIKGDPGGPVKLSVTGSFDLSNS